MVQIGALVAELEVCKDCGNRVFSTLSGFNRPKSAAALRAAALLGRLSSLRLGVHKGASCFGKDSSRLARGGENRDNRLSFPISLCPDLSLSFFSFHPFSSPFRILPVSPPLAFPRPNVVGGPGEHSAQGVPENGRHERFEILRYFKIPNRVDFGAIVKDER